MSDKYHEMVSVFRDSSFREHNLRPDQSFVGMEGMALPPSRSSFFVEPDLEVNRTACDRPLFWLIHAPAGVGKSAFALQLAADIATTGRQALYVPLGGRDIADEWFAGILGQVFPNDPRTAIRDAVRSTATVVVLDGYDELSMTEETISRHEKLFREIKNDVLPPDGDPRAGEAPSVIVLFRSAVLDLGIFDPVADSSWIAELQFFSPVQSAVFLAGYVADDVTLGDQLAREILDVLRGTLGAGGGVTEPEAFFGHAPVLQAIGDLVREEWRPNPAQLPSRLREDYTAGTSGVQLLARIIDRLLEREAGKLSLAAFSEAGVTDLSAVDVFAPAFQEALIHAVLEAHVTATDWRAAVSDAVGSHWSSVTASSNNLRALDQELASEVRRRFSDEVARQLEQHPLLEATRDGLRFANQVYQDRFVAEFMVRRPDFEAATVIAAYPSSAFYLSEFVLRELPGRDLGGRPDLLFFVIRGFLMAEGGGRTDAEIDIVWSSAADGADGWSITAQTRQLGAEPFFFREDILEFEVPPGQRLENVTVDGSEADLSLVWIGARDTFAEAPIGLSQVFVEANEIQLEARAFEFSTARLIGEEIRFSAHVQNLVGLQSLQLGGAVQSSQHLEGQYGKAFQLSTGGDREDERFFLQAKMRAILTWFRKRGKERLGVWEKRFDTVVLRKRQDQDAMDVSEFLIHLGILYVQDQMVYLDQDRLGEYDVYRVSFNDIAFGDGFDRLLSEWTQFASRL